jgi:hypothetical protein
MKKFQINKQKLNLKTLTTPLLALSLMVGCAGLFGGNVSAASVTNNIVFSNKLDLSAGTMVPSTNTTPSAYLTQTATPFTVTDLDPNENLVYWFETQAASNPCTTTPIDVSMTLNYTSNYVVSNQDLGLHLALLDQSMASAIPPVLVVLSPWYYYSPVAHTETINFNVPNVTSSNLYMLLRVTEGADDISNHANGDIITINSATYTLTYPDNMSDCTYPAANNNPTITSPSAATIPSTTASGSTVVPGSSLAATDTDGNTLSYSITAGNDEGYFAIDSNTGNITTTQTNIPAGTYTITVQVDDGKGGTATADVTITVTASAPTYYCPAPYDTTELLTPSGDCDNDGINNQTEGFDPNGDSSPADARDTDGDGIADYVDPDSDNDGLTDAVEGVVDLDSDGKPDYIDPATPPSTTYYCPLPYDTTVLLTPSGDCDNDGIDNQTEGFDPNGDSSPADARDTDGDGIADYVDPDSDNDGITDKVEGTTDTDGDGKPNYVDADSDNDGITDATEGTTDTDGDGKPNYIDTDSDNDGILDATEGTTDTDNDGKPNYIDALDDKQQASQPKNSRPTLANTGQSLKAITIVATMALGLAGYVKLKNKNSKSYRRR